MHKSIKLLNRLWNPSTTAVRNYASQFAQYLANYPSTQYSQLSNGLTIATEERPGAPNACIGFYIDGGSRYESDFEAGIAHFFEHLAFKNTRNRSKAEIISKVACLGASFRCFTTREMVCYYVQCLSPDVTLAVDILSDCVFNNDFLSADIEIQKHLVYQEMLKHDTESQSVIFDFLHSAAFQGTPLAKTVMGPTGNLYNYKVSTLCDYLHRCFDPCRTVMAAVGGIKHEQIVSLANCYLNNMEPLKCLDVDSYRYTGSEIRYRDDSMPVANVIFAVEGPSFGEDDNIVMEIARHAVGSWDRSQLHGELLPTRLGRYASEKPCCDVYKSFKINYKDTGLWGTQFISNTHDVDDMSILIQDHWMYICNCITNEEVNRAKRFARTKLLSDMESTVTTCHDVGRWTLYQGSRPSLLDQVSAIERVQTQDVREVATKYIYDKCPTVVALGAVEGLMEYNRIRAGMYWLRV